MSLRVRFLEVRGPDDLAGDGGFVRVDEFRTPYLRPCDVETVVEQDD